MKKAFITSLIVISYFTIYGCNKNDEATETVNIITTDISVSSAVSTIIWTDNSDLNQQLNTALAYNYGTALVSQTETALDFNSNMTQVIATIDFKTQFQSFYNDTNPSNNTVTINLVQESLTTEGVFLKADGPGNTYNLITSVLAPGANPIETPDCSHNAFGNHIDEVFDNDLNTNVFRFYLHTTPDDDRCINFDRQRNEIKSYSQSPDNLLGIENETVVYKWKFKLPTGFQSSTNFTHIHQLKSVGGALESMPIYTLTTRKGTPDRIELRYAETDNQITLLQTDLAPFLDTWVEVTETIKYSTNGTYDIEIKTINDGTILLTYANPSINNWRPNAEFVRPKWGIYRSIINVQDLRDEEVLFDEFSITEIE